MVSHDGAALPYTDELVQNMEPSSCWFEIKVGKVKHLYGQSLLTKRLPSSVPKSFSVTVWKREKVTILQTTFSTLVLDAVLQLSLQVATFLIEYSLIEFYNNNEYFFFSAIAFCILFFHLHVRSILSFRRIAPDTYSCLDGSVSC